MPWARVHELETELFRANPSFVTIDPIEDIESLLKFGTQDNLMIGTDYSRDISANLSALDEVRSRVDEGRISNAQARRLTFQPFYSLQKKPPEKDALAAEQKILRINRPGPQMFSPSRLRNYVPRCGDVSLQDLAVDSRPLT